jgi:hypothetical protein
MIRGCNVARHEEFERNVQETMNGPLVELDIPGMRRGCYQALYQRLVCVDIAVPYTSGPSRIRLLLRLFGGNSSKDDTIRAKADKRAMGVEICTSISLKDSAGGMFVVGVDSAHRLVWHVCNSWARARAKARTMPPESFFKCFEND